MTVRDDDDRRRIEEALAGSPYATAAAAWLAGGRPDELLELIQAIALGYLATEQNSPPGTILGGIDLATLSKDEPFHRLEAVTTMALRQLMFQTTQLFRSIGVLVAYAEGAVSVSLHVVGRALLENVSVLYWICEPLLGEPGSIGASRKVAARSCLFSAAGTADLLHESEAYDMDDLNDMRAALEEELAMATSAFGPSDLHMSARNPMKWRIGDERRVGRGELVEQVGRTIFSADVHPASHYKSQSVASHSSLGANLGRPVWVDHGERSHYAFVLDVRALESWAWYYAVWFRFGAEVIAVFHDWSRDDIQGQDMATRGFFGRGITAPAPWR